MTRNHTASVPRLTLNTGVEQPAHGYGVFQAPPEQMGAAVQEALYIGYRHVDRAGLTPLFPFGFGLSYTTFELGEPRLVGRHRGAWRRDRRHHPYAKHGGARRANGHP